MAKRGHKVETPDSNQQARPPLGIFQSRCDEKGRVRLPKEFEDFLRTYSEPEFFITSMDGSVVRVYPISLWRENLKVLAEFREKPKAAASIRFMVDFWGGVSTIDSQGRVLVPPVLRRDAGIENGKVYLRHDNGAVEIYSEEYSERRLAEAKAALAENLEILQQKGLK